MTFGERIKQCRTKRNLTQEQLAEKFMVTRQTVSKWELDQIMPETRKLIEIAEYFELSLDELLLGQAFEKDKIVRNKGKENYLKEKKLLIINWDFFKYIIGITIVTIFLISGFGKKSGHWSLCNLIDVSFILILFITIGLGVCFHVFLENKDKQRKWTAISAIIIGFLFSCWYFFNFEITNQILEGLGIAILPLYYGILIAFFVCHNKIIVKE